MNSTIESNTSKSFHISKWCNSIVDHSIFTWSIIFLILINAVIVGLETYQGIYGPYHSVFYLIDRIILWLFTLEIIVKLLAARPTVHFFKDGWNVFDFIIVASGHIFIGSQFMTVLRILRVLRIFRTVSVIPSLRKLTSALLLTLPSHGTILFLMLIVFYIFSVIGTVLYRNVAPEYFGTLQHSALTLFQMVTLESWASGVMRPVMEQVGWSWIYFVSFILIGTFIILNSFVGVIVSNFERVEKEEKENEEENSSDELKQEISLLREEVKELKEILKKTSIR